MHTTTRPRSLGPRRFQGFYAGGSTRSISFPLGGIGSGCIGLAGDGRLIDWEIFNKPNLGGQNGLTHIAVRAERVGKVLDCRVLQGPCSPAGADINSQPMGGFPHFAEVRFHGRYPFATLEFRDRHFPGVVRLIAFNPFIPGNSRDSSIPAAFFRIEIDNPGAGAIDYTVAFSVKNPYPGARNANRLLDEGGFHALHLGQDPQPEEALERGDLCLASDAAVVSHIACWPHQTRGGDEGAGPGRLFWQAFTAGGPLPARPWTPNRLHHRPPGTHATLAAHLRTPARGTCASRFVLAWNNPFVREVLSESPIVIRRQQHTVERTTAWRNHYATIWADSAASARHALGEWKRLEGESRLFADALEGSTIPPVLTEAISANLAILKSPTLIRLEDGSLYGYEGCAATSGCCGGSSNHVYQYAQSVAFLFPDLERSMRELEVGHTMRPDGGLLGRLQLPVGSAEYHFRPCVDGQYATVIKFYRDWKVSGDTAWLRRHWPAIQRVIAFAWADTNQDRWDHDRDGVIEGRQHNTYDNELFGPNAYLTGFYLAALRAGEAMALAVDDAASAKLYAGLRERGTRWVEANLYNGSYYIQQIDLADKSILAPYGFTEQDNAWYGRNDATGIYWDAELGRIRSQFGDACVIDQLLSQWHAGIAGLPDVFRADRVRTTLRSILKHNFVADVAEAWNPYGRRMAVDGEAGTVIATWPTGGKPVLPMRYVEEPWPGCEHAFAALLLQHGLVKEAVRVVTAVRERFDGAKRNPWDEFECGRYYARSMSSYSLLTAISGFVYDQTRGMIGFNPVVKAARFHCFWSLGTAWGTVTFTTRRITLRVLHGRLALAEFRSQALAKRSIASIHADGQVLAHTHRGDTVRAKTAIELGQELVIALGKAR